MFWNKFTTSTIFKIGILLLEIIERIHSAGYTYNDLKLDNIILGDSQFSDESLHCLRLIDFGFAERYRKKDGELLKE